MTQINTIHPMAKEVSALNTYWLVQYLEEHHPSLDLRKLITEACRQKPVYVENLQTGEVEEVGLAHLRNPRHWFSHRFIKTLHDIIQQEIPDPRLAFKIGSTMYKTQPMLTTALGIPLLGIHRVAKKVSSEAYKYNRTKKYSVVKMEKKCIEIRITHNPGINTCPFTMQWNAGCFVSYARLAGATNIKVSSRCIEKGPEGPGDPRRAIWDFKITYQEPGVLTRLAKAALRNMPGIKTLVERAEAIESDHQDQIVNRDNIIAERTADLARANQTMRKEIADRKLAEAALLQNKEQLQRYITAIDDIGLGLCVIDADYRLQVMNTTFTSWFGGHPGKTCYSALMGKKEPCSHCKMVEVIERGKKIRYHPTVPDGRAFEMVATPIHNSDGTISKMEIIRDLSEQKKREQQKLESLQHQEQLKKLESLKTMATAIAHRFNNAMTGVQGNLELLTLALSKNSKEYAMAANAFREAKGASQVGSIMLSYVGQNPLQCRQVALAELVRSTVTSSQNLFHPQVNLIFIPPSQPLYCSVDRQQISEAIENILANAAESLSNDSGSVEITFGNEYFSKASFPLFFQKKNISDGNYIFCRIKDSGHGIAGDNLSKVFEPFYTTRFVGRGLGLALASGIMLAHDGAIIVDSVPGKSTTVQILFPFTPLRSGHPMPVAEVAPNVGTSLSGHILLVDDEPPVLEVGKKFLTMLGFTVHTAVNGKEAIAKIRGQEHDYRAIVMDISMPEINGIQAMESIRQMNPTLPILLSSGYLATEFPFSANNTATAPDGFLAKPFQLADMQSNLELLLSW